ncbi:MAG: nucleoside monophosphate kinase [Patescibacteria group bacterium]
MSSRKVFAFIGPQGSGKGTQAALIASRHRYNVIAMSNLLKAEVEKETPLGITIDGIMQQGGLVPDESTIQLVRQFFELCPDDARIIFDGFPRTLLQAQALDTLTEVTRVVHITLPYEVSVRRITGRLICPRGHNYNRYYVRPREEGICDVDGLRLVTRTDDRPEIVAERLRVYEAMVTHVLDYYSARGKLVTINGDASIEVVRQAIEDRIIGDL